MLIGPFNSGSATGGAGVATANTDSAIRIDGILLGLYVKYNHSPPAGSTDVIVSTKGTSPSAPSITMLTLTNAATDGWFFPRINIHNTSGSAQAAVWDYIPLSDIINVKIQGANNADSADVWFMVGEVT